SGVTRRSFVQAGLLGLGGLGLGDFLRLRAEAQAPRRPGRDTAVILFWLSGGPGHMETWDPKPDAAAEVRGPCGALRTRRPCAAAPTTSSPTRPTSAAAPTRSSPSPTRTARTTASAT